MILSPHEHVSAETSRHLAAAEVLSAIPPRPRPRRRGLTVRLVGMLVGRTVHV